MYHGKKLNVDKRFAFQMTMLSNGMHVLVQDRVCFNVGIVRFFSIGMC